VALVLYRNSNSCAVSHCLFSLLLQAITQAGSWLWNKLCMPGPPFTVAQVARRLLLTSALVHPTRQAPDVQTPAPKARKNFCLVDFQRGSPTQGGAGWLNKLWLGWEVPFAEAGSMAHTGPQQQSLLSTFPRHSGLSQAGCCFPPQAQAVITATCIGFVRDINGLSTGSSTAPPLYSARQADSLCSLA